MEQDNNKKEIIEAKLAAFLDTVDGRQKLADAIMKSINLEMDMPLYRRRYTVVNRVE